MGTRKTHSVDARATNRIETDAIRILFYLAVAVFSIYHLLLLPNW